MQISKAEKSLKSPINAPSCLRSSSQLKKLWNLSCIQEFLQLKNTFAQLLRVFPVWSLPDHIKLPTPRKPVWHILCSSFIAFLIFYHICACPQTLWFNFAHSLSFFGYKTLMYSFLTCLCVLNVVNWRSFMLCCVAGLHSLYCCLGFVFLWVEQTLTSLLLLDIWVTFNFCYYEKCYWVCFLCLPFLGIIFKNPTFIHDLKQKQTSNRGEFSYSSDG